MSTICEVISIIQKFSSEKGKAMLGYEGYIYTFERKTDAKSILRCQHRDCKGKSKYDNNIYIYWSLSID